MFAVTSAQMRDLEARCNEWGLDYRTLMDNAGTAAAYCINETIPVAGKRCIVFCGRGNNGGDGLVVARCLSQLGGQVVVVLTEGTPATRLAQEMLVLAEEEHLEVVDFAMARGRAEELLEDVDIIVDAIYGTGFRGTLPVLVSDACAMINSAIAAVFSLDLPTGIEADDGNGDISCVMADFTVAFDSLKPAHILPLTARQCGNVCLVDIGIPPELKDGIDYRYALMDQALAQQMFIPRRPESHKGDHGRLLIIAGSESYPGAALLTAGGALRSGVGYAELAAVPYVSQLAALRHPELVHRPLWSNDGGRVDAASIASINEAMERATAIAIGPGLGLCEDTVAIVSHVLRTARCPVVLDADGINAVCENINILSEAQAPLILTPHPAELARLLGMSVDEVAGGADGAVGQFSKRHGVYLVCKSHQTYVTPRDTGMYINSTGNAGLARAGSGDVLTGVIGSLLAQGYEPLTAACLGVYLHGLAGDIAAERRSQTAMLPSDVIDCLPDAFLHFETPR